MPCYLVDSDFLLFSSFHVHTERLLAACFKNVLAGEVANFQIFLSDFRADYSVDEGGFGATQTVALLQTTDFLLPRFCLTPKKTERFTVGLEHLGQDFVLPGIKGYTKRKFSGRHCPLTRSYVLQVQGGADSQQILGRPFMQYLEDNPGWFIEGSNDALLIYRRGKNVKPSGWRECRGAVVEIGGLLTVAQNPRKSR